MGVLLKAKEKANKELALIEEFYHLINMGKVSTISYLDNESQIRLSTTEDGAITIKVKDNV